MNPHCDAKNEKHPLCPHPPHPSNGGGESSSESYTGYDETGGDKTNDTYVTQKSAVTPTSAPGALIMAAMAAALAAMAALVVAAKRRRKPDYHKLRGSVKLRMNLFNGFANQCFEERAVSGVQDAAMSQEGMQVV